MRRNYGKVWQLSSEQFMQYVQKSTNWNDLCENIYGIRRGNTRSLRRRVSEEKICTEHFSEKKKKKNKHVIDVKNKLVSGRFWNTARLKIQLIREKLLEEKCSLCNQEPFWMNQKLVLQLDHINGICDDNRIENLRILCPNCHSQTSTFCSRKNKGVDNVCIDCGKIIGKKSKRCAPCYLKHRKGVGVRVPPSVIEGRNVSG